MTAVHSVFINCPFDDAYRPVHHALVLSVVTCGFEPRSALETGTVAKPRMQRIGDALRASTYSIHDLTRAHGDPAHSNLARFNMPFEFGMAFNYAEVTSGARDQHDWLALVPKEHRYGEFISDLAGYDLLAHDGTAASVIPPALSWLTTRPHAVALPQGVDPASLIALLDDYEELVAAEAIRWGGHAHLRWSRLVVLARDLVAARL